MYRADLPRTLTLVVAPLLTLAPTSVFARKFRAANQSEDYPTARGLDFERTPFKAAMLPLYRQARRDPTSALIDRIRKVE